MKMLLTAVLLFALSVHASELNYCDFEYESTYSNSVCEFVIDSNKKQECLEKEGQDKKVFVGRVNVFETDFVTSFLASRNANRKARNCCEKWADETNREGKCLFLFKTKPTKTFREGPSQVRVFFYFNR